MTDIHSHILPGMDDGSRSTEESLAMLAASAAQGVRAIAATPHFYAMENSPEEFLARREAAEARLLSRWESGLPRIRVGAEVGYFEGMSRSKALEALRIQNTELLLLEMPFTQWSKRQLSEVRDVAGRPGVTVVLAHIERYWKLERPGVWDALLEVGVRFQCNAECFLHWRTRGRALRLLRQGRIHLLGSDCHNMEWRPPRLGEAAARLEEADLARLAESERALLPGWEEMRG